MEVDKETRRENASHLNSSEPTYQELEYVVNEDWLRPASGEDKSLPLKGLNERKGVRKQTRGFKPS